MMYREIGLQPPLLLYWIFTAVQELMLELAGILSLVSQAQEQWPHVVPPWLTCGVHRSVTAHCWRREHFSSHFPGLLFSEPKFQPVWEFAPNSGRGALRGWE